MTIKFKRPMFMTNKYLDVYQNQGKLGKLRYYRKSNIRNVKFDVNIETIGFDQTYQITQQSFDIREGHQWSIVKNGSLIAKMNSGKVKEIDQVNAQLSDNKTLLIKAKFSFKPSADISIDGKPIGEASTKGMFLNSNYEIHLWESINTIDPLLLAGITYAFFSTSNHR